MKKERKKKADSLQGLRVPLDMPGALAQLSVQSLSAKGENKK